MKRLHFMGIGGSGANAVACIAHAKGYVVSGCDAKRTEYTRGLEKLEIKISYEHSVEHLANQEMLCVTPALLDQQEKPKELLAAYDLGIKVMTWQQFMGEYLQQGKKVIAVAGTKGKSTTTSLIGQLLIVANLDPTVQIGAEVRSWGQNYRVGESEWFLCEADEFHNNFHHYHADIAIITNIEMDHPEFFKSYEEYLNSYVDFVKQMKSDSTLILGLDSQGVNDLLKKIDFYKGNIVTYSADEEMEIVSQLPGEHNNLNLRAVLKFAELMMIDESAIASFLLHAELPARRFEIMGEYKGAVLVDDYAHNPMSIKAALQAARSKYAGYTIWAVWQPHMYSRTIEFFDEFVNSFDQADRVIVLPIFASREKGSTLAKQVSSGMISDELAKIKGKSAVMSVNSIEEAVGILRQELDQKCVLINMGAGDNTAVVKLLLER